MVEALPLTGRNVFESWKQRSRATAPYLIGSASQRVLVAGQTQSRQQYVHVRPCVYAAVPRAAPISRLERDIAYQRRGHLQDWRVPCRAVRHEKKANGRAMSAGACTGVPAQAPTGGYRAKNVPWPTSRSFRMTRIRLVFYEEIVHAFYIGLLTSRCFRRHLLALLFLR